MDEKFIGTRIKRQLIITAGFLPGLWFYVGMNPETEIGYVIIDVIAAFMAKLAFGLHIDEYWFGKFAYYSIGNIATAYTVIFEYLTGGGWAILLLLMAFVGGFAINYELFMGIYTIHALGFWIFLIAWVITPFIPINYKYLV